MLCSQNLHSHVFYWHNARYIFYWHNARYIFHKTFSLMYFTDIMPATYFTNIMPATYFTNIMPTTYFTNIMPTTHFTNIMPATYFDRAFSVVISECKGKVQLLQCVNLHHTMKVQGGVEVHRHPLFTSAQLHAAVALPPGKNTDNHCIMCCVGPRAGLDLEQQGQIRCLCWERKSDNCVCTYLALWV